MTAPLFYVDAVTERLSITGEQARHAAGSLRLSVGEEVLVCDGRGTVGRSQVAQVIGRDELVLDVHDLTTLPVPRTVRVVQAIPKAERGELAVELLTETGADEIVPWASARTVADWRGKQDAKVQRWRRVALAAAKQSRRAFLPTVAELCTGLPEPIGSTLVLHEDADTSLFTMDLPQGPLTVVVGPEGGLTEDEVGGLVAGGAQAVRLGSEILRTSTAGAAACVWIRGYEKRTGT